MSVGAGAGLWATGYPRLLVKKLIILALLVALGALTAKKLRVS